MLRTVSAMALLIAFASASALADWDSPPRHIQRVGVVPFSVRGDSSQNWLGPAMQDGLAAAMGKISGVIIAGVAPDDAAAAREMARTSGVDAVVFGNIQLANGQMRVTGQIIAMDTGELLGTLKFDGTERSLFDIEDVLGARVERLVSPPPPKAPTSSAPAVALDIVGPTVAPPPPKYFDGDLMTEIKPSDKQLRQEYDQYYYYSADTAGGWWYGPGWGWGGCALGCYPWLGIGCPVPAYPVSGW